MTESVAQAGLLLAQVATAAASIRDDLDHALSVSETEAVRACAAYLPALGDDEVVTFVFVGQHDAGKSSLLRCLTGRQDIVVGAGPTTNRTDIYHWSGHRLVDTPGVRAGVDEAHDRITEEALRLADVVVFVLTVEGLDDTVASYFSELRQRIRTVGQLLMVVNKALSERSDRQEVEGHLRSEIGSIFDQIPHLWTDASSWLDAVPGPRFVTDQAQSGIAELAATLTDISRQSGAHVRMMKPLRLWSEAAQEAIREISVERGRNQEAGEDLASLDRLLADLEAQQVGRCRDVQDRADDAISELVNGLRLAGPNVDEQALGLLVAQARATFEDQVELSGENRDQELLEAVDHPGTEVVPIGSQVGVDLRGFLASTLKKVSREFAGAGARPGGAGHRAVTRSWHLLGGKFRPWGAVKATEGIGRAANAAGTLLNIAPEVWAVWTTIRDGRRQQQQAELERNWSREALSIAEGVVAEWRAAGLTTVEQVYEVRADAIRRRRLGLLVQLSADNEEVQRLSQIDARIAGLLGQLGDDLIGDREPVTG